MSTIVKLTNGTFLTEIPEQSINTAQTSLALVGRGSVAYSRPMAENFVRLLENFSNLTPPANPLRGQLWYDTSAGILKLFDGIAWGSTASSALAGLTSGPGINVVTSGGTTTLTLAPTPVTPGAYTNANIVIDSTGRIIAAGSGGLLTTTVNPGSYTNANITVDQFGRVTSATSGTAGSDTPLSAGIIYVRPDGNDSNQGTSNTASSALKTITAALSLGFKTPRLRHQLRIILGTPGNYDAPNRADPDVNTIEPLMLGAGIVIIEGDTTSQDTYIINGSGFPGNTGILQVGFGTYLHLKGVTVNNLSPATYNHITATGGGVVNVENVTFSGTANTVAASNTAVLYALDGGHIRINTGTKVSCSQPYFVRCFGGGASLMLDLTVVGPLTFAQAFIGVQSCGRFTVNSTFTANAVAASGTITGARYAAIENGVINTNGRSATFFPGSAAGSTATGGLIS